MAQHVMFAGRQANESWRHVDLGLTKQARGSHGDAD